MEKDPFTQFKAMQREGWSLFAPLELITTAPAGLLVEFAQVKTGDKVLDVGCGTGVVGVTAARMGAQVKGLDLSPVLLDRAHKNSEIARVNVEWKEGDAEALPYRDGEFDVVLSQFGHMFAPRPEIAIAEMLRVLKPGGRIAFSTWPPEMYTGRMFALTAQYLPPPEGVAPPPLWGEPKIIRERLGDRVADIHFDRQVMVTPCLSPEHARATFESTAGPLTKLNATLSKEDPAKLEKFRRELEALIASFMKGNTLQQHFLMTRARKK